MCNLTCGHCHVEAGPNRTEHITPELIVHLQDAIKKFSISTVDLTGGAPEMCPGFKDYVRAFRALGCEVIIRSNLTILLEPGYEDMVDFFLENQLRVVASLPCYSQDNVDAQRGDGVFAASIDALIKLNKAGYAQPNSGLFLDLVYNPGGASLPGPERELELVYKDRLMEDFGVKFNSLFAITNIPIGRFYSDLKKQGKADAYDTLLRNAFNSGTVSHLMCRNTLNISWDGWVYDCDFNQMIELPTLVGGKPLHVCQLNTIDSFDGEVIRTGNHCFGCTAGAGSSCGGELID
ncbi:UNVERIFIED_CONTAM: hypothetical protein GTU68_029985 [Idotea baltica]|nr:hypothetical protein [Idotea baltica]